AEVGARVGFALNEVARVARHVDGDVERLPGLERRQRDGDDLRRLEPGLARNDVLDERVDVEIVSGKEGLLAPGFRGVEEEVADRAGHVGPAGALEEGAR